MKKNINRMPILRAAFFHKADGMSVSVKVDGWE
ncbi:hypothetical protein GGR08_000296 [Bartonella fuyuanensis]|uniref:Uncharacterized protein n=1 Tax=Bartonella fuyuanensis TaxID=1460968 RepID=A0A840DWX0_9HYPH|nr:hypothetical protein [Bartonella fuyuanensis]